MYLTWIRIPDSPDSGINSAKFGPHKTSGKPNNLTQLKSVYDAMFSFVEPPLASIEGFQ